MPRIKITIFVTFISVDAFLLIWSFTPLANARLDGDEGIDPDRPAGVQGPFDGGEYIKQREAFVALLRGVDPSKPFDGTARMRANNVIDGQVAALTRAVE